MIIKDKELGKFEIHHDGNNYSVVENTNKQDVKGNDIFKNHAYCSSVESAIKKVIKLQVEDTEETYSLKKYINEIRATSERIESLLK